MKKDVKAGFTLAEVLITLGVIGIVAVITLPNLMQKSQEKEIVARLQKDYSLLSQAFMQAQNEYGEFSSWNVIDDNQTSTRECFSYIEPFLKIAKKCDNKSGCWAKTTKSLSGQTAQWSGSNYIGVNFIGFTLLDGTNISFDLCGWPGYAYFGWPTDIHYPIGLFYVDVNGDREPNILGRDIFGFALSDKGLIPFGANDKSKNCNPSINNNTSGYGCTYKVLKEKAINY
ncbi:MAG: type II secretion system protein [Candidatus Gastranaerophilaceae bacterium]